VEIFHYDQPIITFTADHETVLHWGQSLIEQRIGSTTSGEIAITGTYHGVPLTFRTPDYWPGENILASDSSALFEPVAQAGETPVANVHALSDVVALPIVSEARRPWPTPYPRS
jgi:hypothetical protein